MIILKKIKKKVIKQKPVMTDDSYQFKNLIIIISTILLLIVSFYFITKLVLNNRKVEKEISNVSDVEIQKEKILVGQLLNRNKAEYYVIAYKNDNQFISLFNTYIEKYSEKEDSLSFYRIDLDEGLNKNYISDEANISDDLKELKINDTILFKIKEGKIDSYYIGNENVLDYLKEING